VQDGTVFHEAPKWMFDILGLEGDKDKPSHLQIALPPDLEKDGEAILKEFMTTFIPRLHASHALAGYALATSPYEEEESQTSARARSMRHRGVDILLGEADRVTVGRDGIKGVNWLTFIDKARVDRLGGQAALASALDPAVGVLPLAGGLLFQAGEAPALGDQNRRDRLPLYRSVFKALEPLTPAAFDRALDLAVDDYDNSTDLTLAWRRRLAT
jgi:hypothetical protein